MDISETLDIGSRLVSALVLDISEGGLGVEAGAHFPAGELVEFRAIVIRGGVGLRFDGKGRVIHSREIGPGRFRIGLQFRDVIRSRLAVDGPAGATEIEATAMPNEISLAQLMRARPSCP